MKRKTTTKIILHCSATREGQNITAKTIKKWHLEKGWQDIGYHYIIDIDGTIERGRPLDEIGAHCVNQNNCSIGICYIGGCDKDMKAKDTRTPQQIRSMLVLVQFLLNMYKLDIDDVYGHYQFAAKDCPSFDIKQFKELYRNTMN